MKRKYTYNYFVIFALFSFTAFCANGQAFGPSANFATASQPNYVQSSDFNGDGITDLVAGCEGNSISILLGNGNGTFQAPQFITAGSAPMAVTVGDFNGDGKMDIAAANYFSNSVSIFIGNGDGTFQAAQDYSVGNSPRSIAMGNLNGKACLVTCNVSDDSISVLLGNGDGTFQAAASYPVGSNPFAVAVADFNGDGFLDIATANYNGNNVRIMLGAGNGAFTTGSLLAVGINPTFVSVGDLNADGKMDLVVTNSNSNSISVLLGNGDGSFQPPANYAVGSNPRNITLSDLNHDGNLDAVVANFNDNNVSVLAGIGNGTFGSAVNFSVGSGAEHVIAADFDHDGALDLACVAHNGDVVSVLLNQSAFSVTSIFPASGSTLNAPAAIAVGLSKFPDGSTLNSGTAKLVRAGPDGILGTADDVGIVPKSITSNGNSINIDLTGVVLRNDLYQLTLKSPSNGPPPNPVASLNFDEGTGLTTADSSGNANHATLTGGASWTSGVNHTGVAFDGIDGQAKILRSASLEPASAITVSLWGRMTNAVAGGVSDLVRKVGPFQGGYLLRWSSANGHLEWHIDLGSGQNLVVQNPTPNDAYLNEWHHYAATFDGSAHVSSLYVDGVLVASANGGPAVLEHTDDLYLMYVNYGSQVGTPGALDEFKVYDRALTSAEIAQLATRGVRSTNGGALDGEFSGNLPSGNGTPGGDFVSVFTLKTLEAEDITFNVTEDISANGILTTTGGLGPLTYSIQQNGTHGTATVTNTSTGAFVYLPNDGVTGPDSFTFKANDGTRDSNTATVSVTIAPAAPVISSAETASATVGNVFGYAIVASHNPTSFSATGLPSGLNVDPVSGAISGTPSVGGTFPITLGATNSVGTGNLQLILAVNKIAPIITWNAPASIVYGTPLDLVQLNATANAPGGFVYSPALGNVLSAGTNTLNVLFTPTDGSTYSSAPASVAIIVKPAPLIVAADDKIKVYGTANPPLTSSYFGFVNGDTQNSLATQPLFTTAATTGSGTGAYAIVPGGAASPNYTISFVPGALNVTKALLSISADTKSKTYGAPNPVLTASFMGFVNGDGPANLTSPVILNTVATDVSAAGNFPITVSGAASPNYFVAFANDSLSVLPAPLSITADDKSRYFGLDNPPLTASYSGFVNGDTASILVTPTFITTQASNTSVPGAYPIFVTGASSPNYFISFKNGILAVQPLPLPPVSPQITNALTATAVQGQPFSFPLQASGTTPIAFTATGLPAGLSIVGNEIVGTTQVIGAAQIVLTATNPEGTDTRVLFLVISPAIGVTLQTPGFASPPPSPSSSVAGHPITLSAAAGDNASALVYTWNFGDGTSGIGQNVSHVYSAAGIYQATVTISDGVHSISEVVEVPVNSTELTPVEAAAFQISKALLKFSFSTHQDMMSFSGTIPVKTGDTVADEPVVLIVGTKEYVIDLDSMGKTADRSFLLAAKIKNGKFTESKSGFAVKLKNQNLFDGLKVYGFSNANLKKPGATISVPVVVSIGQVSFATMLQFKYTAKAGKTGSGQKH